MVKIENLKIQLFADGANLKEIDLLSKNPLIKGFTTNPSLMKKSGVEDYKDFALKLVKLVPNKPISLEVFADEEEEMIRQAKLISSLGENINVKVPIMNTKGVLTGNVIKELSKNNIKLNITAVFTLKQVEYILKNLEGSNYTIISVFAGRIADSGIDPELIIKNINKNYILSSNVHLLWASTRETFNIIQAERVGCKIITVSNDILKKINLFNKNQEEYSKETVKMFYDDAMSSGFKI
jgi:transaldolase